MHHYHELGTERAISLIQVCVCVCKPLDTRGFEPLPLLLETKPWKCLSFETGDLCRSFLKPWICDLFRNRGAQKAHRAVPNEALYGDLRISGLINQTYLFSNMARG